MTTPTISPSSTPQAPKNQNKDILQEYFEAPVDMKLSETITLSALKSLKDLTKILPAFIHAFKYVSIIPVDETTNSRVPTVCVNPNAHIEFNTLFFSRFLEGESNRPVLSAILYHECRHWLNNHVQRFVALANKGIFPKSRDILAKGVMGADRDELAVWGQATDMEINSEILDNPYFKGKLKFMNKTEFPFVDPEAYGFPRGNTAEWYTEQLMNQMTGGASSKYGPGSCDHMTIGLDKDTVEMTPLVREMMDKLQTVVKTAQRQIQNELKEAGSGTAGMDIEADITPVNYDWKKLIKGKFSSISAIKISGSDYNTYRKMNRKMVSVSQDVIFPGRYSLKVKMRIGFYLDTSGSMFNDYGKILSYVFDLKRYQHENIEIQIDLVTVDWEVHQVFEDISEDPSVVTRKGLKGGGGTDMTKCWTHAKEQEKEGIKYDMIIVATDGYTPWPPARDYHNISLVLITEQEKYSSCPYKKALIK